MESVSCWSVSYGREVPWAGVVESIPFYSDSSGGVDVILIAMRISRALVREPSINHFAGCER